MNEPYDQNLADKAAGQILAAAGISRCDVAVTLGSGWAQAAELLGETVADIPADEVSGFRPPALEGHRGTLRVIRLPGGKYCLIIGARTHLYEGHGVGPVAHGVRVAKACGADIIVLTNGAGSTVADWNAGTVVMINDHINLTAHSPMDGAFFQDMTEVYDAGLRSKVRELVPEIPEGVYVQLRGPQYETPAEIRMVMAIGGQLVGMSTALEAIMARTLNMRVMGFSLVTNLAAGLDENPLSHEEVLAVSRQVEARTSELLARVVKHTVSGQ